MDSSSEGRMLRLLPGGETFEIRTRDDVIYRFQLATDLDRYLLEKQQQPRPRSQGATASTPAPADVDGVGSSSGNSNSMADADDIGGWVDAIEAAVRARRMR